MTHKKNNDDYNLRILVNAKDEYTQQLVTLLKPLLYEGISSIYNDAKTISYHHDKVLMTF